jgi:hypothetical protein
MANLSQQVDILIAGLLNDSGTALSGGKVYFYDAGTTNDRTTWTDHDRSTPAAQPVRLDSEGRALIYAHGAYKIKVTDSSDVELYTRDNLIFQRNQLVDDITYEGCLTLNGDVTFDTTTFHVDSSNNRIGIGTITPSTLLHVSSDGSANVTLEADSGNDGANDDVEILFKLDGSTAFSLGVDDSDSDKFVLSRAGSLGTNNVFEVDSSGNVTINGNSTFTGTLSSTSDGAMSLTLGADTGNDGSNDDVQIILQLDGSTKFSLGVDDSDADKFVLSRAGNVGTNNVLEVDSSGNLELKTLTTLSGGVIGMSVDAKTTTFTASTDKDFYECSSAGGAYTITLPAISGITGKVFTFKKTTDDVNAITIDGNGAETIDGSADTTIDTIGETLVIVATASEWEIISRKTETGWISRTVTGAWSSGATYTCRERRQGTDAIYDVNVACTGAVTAANLTITLPTGRTIDTSVLTNTNATVPLLGSQTLLFDDNTSTEYYGGVTLTSSTIVQPNVLTDNGGNETYSPFNNADLFTKAANDFVNLKFRVPISGWNA